MRTLVIALLTLVTSTCDDAMARKGSFASVDGWGVVRVDMTPAEAGEALARIGVKLRYDENRGYMSTPAGEPVVHRSFPVLILALDDGWRGEIRFDDHDRLEWITLDSDAMDAKQSARALARLEKRYGAAAEDTTSEKTRRLLWTNAKLRLVVFVSDSGDGLSTMTQRYVAVR